MTKEKDELQFIDSKSTINGASNLVLPQPVYHPLKASLPMGYQVAVPLQLSRFRRAYKRRGECESFHAKTPEKHHWNTYLFARMTPSFPGGANTTIFLRRFTFDFVLCERVDKLAPGMVVKVTLDAVVDWSFSSAAI